MSKILTIVYSLGKGGTQRAAQNFAEAYLLNGHDSRVLATCESGVRQRELESAGVHTWFPLSESHLAQIADWRPDVIHIHSHGLQPIEVESVLDAVPTARAIETNVFSKQSPWADRLSNSYQLSQWCLWLFKRRATKNWPCAVVPYPVKTSALTRSTGKQIESFRGRRGVCENQILLGRIGQAFDGKWSPLLIHTFNELRAADDRFCLLLVNPPSSIVRLAEDSKYRSSITMIDELIGDEKLAVTYSSIDIFVHIADQGESFGMVLAESLLCETPVVTLSTPWADNSQGEVVGNGDGGYVATTRRGLKSAILELANDRELRRQMGRKGRQQVIARYDYRSVAEQALQNVETHTPAWDDAGVPSIYFETVDNPALLAKVLIRSPAGLKWLKYVQGCRSWTSIADKWLAKRKTSPTSTSC